MISERQSNKRIQSYNNRKKIKYSISTMRTAKYKIIKKRKVTM